MTKLQDPICVDLDGSLLRVDTLAEGALLLLGKNPLLVFLLPLWLMRGKAYLKQEIARRTPDRRNRFVDFLRACAIMVVVFFQRRHDVKHEFRDRNAGTFAGL